MNVGSRADYFLFGLGIGFVVGSVMFAFILKL
jgi:hypothetical protein